MSEKISMVSRDELSVIYCKHLDKEVFEKMGSFSCKYITEYVSAYNNYKGTGFDIDPPNGMHICGQRTVRKCYPILENYCPEYCMRTPDGYCLCVNYINKKYGLNAVKGEIHYD